jgi:hypothetical protein
MTGSRALVRDVAALLDRFDVPGVHVVPADADGWAVLRITEGDRPMPDMLASLDAACTALQVEGGYQFSFGWSHQAPENARRLPVPRWPNVVLKASDFTPLDGIVTDFCTRTALLNRHFWEAAG